MNPSHDIALALFEINETAEQLEMVIRIDKEDFEKALKIEKELNTNDFSMIDKYLNEHIHLKLNGQSFRFLTQELNKEELIYEIKCTAPKEMFIVRSVQVKNTCLLDIINKQSNLVTFNFNDKSRTFRLHKGRKMTEFGY